MTSTTLLIGRIPASVNRRCIQARRLAHRDARRDRDEARAAIGRLDDHPRTRHLLDDRCGLVLLDDEGPAEVRRELAGHAHDSHRIRAVRCDRQVEDDVVETEDLADVGAERGIGRQLEDARMVVAEAELTRRAEHALRDDAADLAALDREVSRQHRADWSERHDHAGFDVGRAAHHPLLPGAEVDVGEADPIGVGMRDHVENPGDDDAVHVPARRVDGLDLESELVQRVGNVGDRDVVERRELTNP